MTKPLADGGAAYAATSLGFVCDADTGVHPSDDDLRSRFLYRSSKQKGMTPKLATKLALLSAGFALLLFGMWNWLLPRARFLSSSPSMNAVVATSPSVVAIDFSEELARESTISVASTITLAPDGEKIYGDGKRFTAKGAAGTKPRSLSVSLDRDLPNGLYWVQWTAISARGRSQRSGRFCFGVGMSIPDDILRDMSQTVYERDSGYRQQRALLLGGVILVGLGFILPRRFVS